MTRLLERNAAQPGGFTTAFIVEALRADIAEGRIAPGAALRQEELAVRFGTSRIPVREALRALQAEGLVAYAPNRGASVASISTEDIAEMLEVRIALECHALRLAVPRFGDADVAAARDILAAYDAAPGAKQWSEMNWRFHWALYRPCDCARLLDAIERNFRFFHSLARRQVSELTGKERPQREHHRLLALVEKERTEEAVALLADHIRHAQRAIRAQARRARPASGSRGPRDS